MLNLQERIALLTRLQQYITSTDEAWQNAKREATLHNAWFIAEFVDIAIQQIASGLLEPEALQQWCAHYKLGEYRESPKNVGIVMAGNIPLVGFHDFLSVFISGHRQTIKLSSKDNVLLRFLVGQMIGWNEQVAEMVRFEDLLKGCDAYIATGSNNTSNYFKSYFGKYPSIIRSNRTSVGILSGNETTGELSNLADDVYLYFGLGCRNITKIYVPRDYDFAPMLETFKKYDHLIENHKYKHNYDYQLALQIINQQFYMTNGSIILAENGSVFSPISQLNYAYYDNRDEVFGGLNPEEIQAIAGTEKMPFGAVQHPGLFDYADGIDTMHFLQQI